MSEAGRKRNRGRAARVRSRAGSVVAQRPWRQPTRPYAPIQVLSDDQLELIHERSLDILEQIGVEVLLDEAVDIYRQAGAKVGTCLLYTSPSPRDQRGSRMPSSA